MQGLEEALSTELTIGDICEGIFNKHPHWYSKLDNTEKAITFNILGSEGKYFDADAGCVKEIPEGKYAHMDRDCNLTILNKV